MKLVVAYIQPHMLGEVKQELYRAGIYKMSVTHALGCGQQRGYTKGFSPVNEGEVNLLKKTRIEIALKDDQVDATVEAITRAARTGEIGDGKIFILPILECVRIRTGETGEDAIG